MPFKTISTIKIILLVKILGKLKLCNFTTYTNFCKILFLEVYLHLIRRLLVCYSMEIENNSKKSENLLKTLSNIYEGLL